MVEAADDGAAPPPELRLAWWCGDHNLPEEGGVLDQDYGLMYRMRVLDGIYRSVVKVRSMTGAQIHHLSDPERRLLRVLRDEGLI